MNWLVITKNKKEQSKVSMKVKNNRSKLIDNFQLWTMVAPTVILLFIFAYIPMAGIVLAFKNFQVSAGIFKSPWVGFKNFEFFFTSNDAWRITRNTLGLNFMFIVVGTIASVVFALLMFEVKKKFFVKTYQTITILPNFLSWVVVGYITYALLETNKGVINNVFISLGINPISWYSEAKYWPGILLIVNLWHSVGMGSIIYYAGLMGIDTEYFEAAAIDGATKLKMTWHITLPFIVPLMTIMTILSIGRIFRADFGLFFNVTRSIGTLYSTTDVIDTYVYRALMSSGDVGMGAAVGLFQSFVGFVMILVTNFIVKKIEPDNSLF